MATVPKLASLSVAPSAAPNVQLQNANTADLTTIGARQAQQFGQAVGGAGNALEQMRYQATEQANALRVDDALNQAQERAIRLQHDPKEGYTNLKGYDALNREGGQPLAEEFTAKLDTQFSEIAGTLGNERQKQMFQMRANNLRTQFLGGALQYEGAQHKEYTLSVRDATVKNAADALVINSTDPKNVGLQETRIRSAIMGGVDPDSGVFVPGSAQMQGKSAAWASEKADEAVSGAHAAAISKAMEMGDMNGAMAYRKRYGQSMTATDMLKVDGTLQKNYETMRGAAIGAEIVKSTQATVQPSDMNRLTNIVRGLESGSQGAFGADGKLLQGPVTRAGERAQGDMQVMPATARDPGYGIKPADLTGTPQQQASELARVGREKLSVLVKMYDGDIAKAAAAYNWGEGNVDKAVKSSNFGKRPDGSQKAAGFLGVLNRPDGGISTEVSVGVNIGGKEMDIPTLVPTLTSAEVKQVLSLKEGQPMPEVIVQKAVDHARARIDAGKSPFASNSEAPGGVTNAWLAMAPPETQAYVAKVIKQMQDPAAGTPPRPTLVEMQDAARARLGPNASPFALKQAIETIDQQYTAQGKAIQQRKDETVAVAYQALEQAGGRWSDVPANVRAKVQELAPDKLDDLRNFGVRAAKGDDVTDDRLYLRLTTNPQSMAKMSDAEFYQLRGGLSKSDFDHFTKMRADIKAGKTSDSAGDLNTGAVSRFTDARLRGLGLDPTPKDGSNDAQAMGARRRFIDSSLLDAQRQAGKKFTDAEVQQHIDGLFAQNVQFRSSFLGIFNSTTNRQLLSMKPGDVPAADADRIRKAFKAQGNASPSDGDVLGAYMAGVAGQKNRDPKTGSF